MRVYQNEGSIRRRTIGRKGRGVLNTLINKLPFEAHIPGYRFCGPGTRLNKRLARGDRGINPLDEACKEHDIAYSQHQDLQKRHEADRILADKAWERFRSKDAKFGEKTAALAITGVMKGKTKLGMGARNKRRRSFKRGKKRVGGTLNFQQAIAKALVGAKGRKGHKKKKIGTRRNRIIQTPKTGGIIPLIPLFAALGALGSLGGGAAAVAKAVGDSKAAAKDLKEKERHNRTMEALAGGRGLYLRPYRGLGLSKNFL